MSRPERGIPRINGVVWPVTNAPRSLESVNLLVDTSHDSVAARHASLTLGTDAVAGSAGWPLPKLSMKIRATAITQRRNAAHITFSPIKDLFAIEKSSHTPLPVSTAFERLLQESNRPSYRVPSFATEPQCPVPLLTSFDVR
jgi:hypothetical protein